MERTGRGAMSENDLAFYYQDAIIVISFHYNNQDINVKYDTQCFWLNPKHWVVKTDSFVCVEHM